MVRHFRVVNDLDVPPRLSAIRFGSLITTPSAPHQDYFDLSTVTSADGKKPTVDGDELANVEEVLGSLKEGKLRGLLTHFATASIGHKSQGQTQFATRQLKEYRVDNSDAWFTDLCASPDGRKWMEERIKRGSPIYIVVGCRTISDATFARGSGTSTTADASGGDPQSGVGGSASGTFAQGFRRGYAAPDERVFALQLRQITFDFFAAKSVDAAVLKSKNHWKQIATFRSGDDAVITAALVDEVQYEEDEEDGEGDDGEGNNDEGRRLEFWDEGGDRYTF